MMPDEMFHRYRAIKEFLFDLGGNYKSESAEFIRNIFTALATGQYICICDDNRILSFASWWMIEPEDLETAKADKMPKNITNGSLMFITEAGSVQGLNVLRRELRALGKKGVAWNRPVKNKHFASMEQKGVEHG